MRRVRTFGSKLLQLTVLPRTVSEELVVDPHPRGGRVLSLLYGCASVALLVACSATLDGSISHAWWLPLVMFVTVYGSESARQAGTNGTAVSFGYLFLLSALMTFGPVLGVILPAVLGRFLAQLRTLPLTGGIWGAIFNGMQLLFDCGWALLGVVALQSLGMPTWACITGAAVIYLVVNLASMAALTGVESGFSAARTNFVEWLREDVHTIAFTAPMLLLVTTAMLHAPMLAFVGTAGIMYLLVSVSRAGEKLLLAEHHLTRDPLTGLVNRRGLWGAMEQIVERCDTNGRALGVMVMDIDNFKRLNDTHGHIEGDTALTVTGDAISRVVRDSDIACRFGGEEFAVVLENTTPHAVHEVAERIRIEVEQALEPWGTSISIGVTIRDPHGPTGTALLNIADMALYQAKFTGKNRVCEAECIEGIEDPPIQEISSVERPLSSRAA